MSEKSPGEIVFNCARPWLLLENTAGGLVPHITDVWDRMRAPRRGDIVVDLQTLVRGSYDPSRLGFYSSHDDRSWSILPYDEPDGEIRIEGADFVAIPGVGDDWPQRE
jgi:hypothetical protein